MVPIVVLTARHAESEKVELLNAGADDYVTKPFGTAELAARVAAQLRRTPRRQPDLFIHTDGFSIDFERRIATRDATAIRLTPIEWGLLRALSADPGRVLTHQQLFDAVWGQAYGDVRQYLRVHVTHLRRKIERNPANPSIIITEPGVGYRFNATK
jgi:two-component system KDP operon response regulator KdpE